MDRDMDYDAFLVGRCGGDPCHEDNDAGVIALNETIDHNKPTDILMQYTGLKDKNGKEIYEGDVVEWVWENGNIYREVVKWKEIPTEETSCFGFEFSGDLISKYGGRDTVEIIGNIYENPELLETLND